MANPLGIGNGDHGRAKMAEKYFLSKNYDKATPLFAQLVSNHPNNYKYNYYYGVCLLIIEMCFKIQLKFKSSIIVYLTRICIQHIYFFFIQYRVHSTQTIVHILAHLY